MMDRQVSDLAVIVALVVVSIVAVWITGPLSGLSTGIGIGLVIAVVHGVLRSTDGIYLDESGAVSNGLVSARPPL